MPAMPPPAAETWLTLARPPDCFIAVSATFVRSLDVPWPHTFSQLCSRIGVININVLQLPKSACLHPEPAFYDEFMVSN